MKPFSLKRMFLHIVETAFGRPTQLICIWISICKHTTDSWKPHFWANIFKLKNKPAIMIFTRKRRVGAGHALLSPSRSGSKHRTRFRTNRRSIVIISFIIIIIIVVTIITRLKNANQTITKDLCRWSFFKCCWIWSRSLAVSLRSKLVLMSIVKGNLRLLLCCGPMCSFRCLIKVLRPNWQFLTQIWPP